MTGFDWFVVAWWTLCIIVTVLLIGKPRATYTPGMAAISCGFFIAMIAGLLWSNGAFA